MAIQCRCCAMSMQCHNDCEGQCNATTTVTMGEEETVTCLFLCRSTLEAQHSRSVSGSGTGTSTVGCLEASVGFGFAADQRQWDARVRDPLSRGPVPYRTEGPTVPYGSILPTNKPVVEARVASVAVVTVFKSR